MFNKTSPSLQEKTHANTEFLLCFSLEDNLSATQAADQMI